MMLYHFFLLHFFIGNVLLADQCSMLINEINSFYDSGKDFIELKSYNCPSNSKPIMKNFMILRIATSINLNEFILNEPRCYSKIDMVIKLYHQKFRDGKSYFVIGSPKLNEGAGENVIDLPFTDSAVLSREKIVGSGQHQTNIADMFRKTTPSTTVYDKRISTFVGSILLHADEQRLLPKFTLDSKGTIHLDVQTSKQIELYLHDMIILSQNLEFQPSYGSSDYYNVLLQCGTFYATIYPKWRMHKHYEFILPERDTRRSNGDVSLSRCPNVETNRRFEFTFFKHSRPTPSTINDCTNSQFAFNDPTRTTLTPVATTTTTTTNSTTITSKTSFENRAVTHESAQDQSALPSSDEECMSQNRLSPVASCKRDRKTRKINVNHAYNEDGSANKTIDFFLKNNDTQDFQRSYDATNNTVQAYLEDMITKWLNISNGTTDNKFWNDLLQHFSYVLNMTGNGTYAEVFDTIKEVKKIIDKTGFVNGVDYSSHISGTNEKRQSSSAKDDIQLGFFAGIPSAILAYFWKFFAPITYNIKPVPLPPGNSGSKPGRSKMKSTNRPSKTTATRKTKETSGTTIATTMITSTTTATTTTVQTSTTTTGTTRGSTTSSTTENSTVLENSTTSAISSTTATTQEPNSTEILDKCSSPSVDAWREYENCSLNFENCLEECFINPEVQETSQSQRNLTGSHEVLQQSGERCREIVSNVAGEARASTACEITLIDEVIREDQDTSYFRDSWLKMIAAHQPDLISPGWFTKERKSWLIYMPNTIDPKLSRLGCRLCQKYRPKLTDNAYVSDLAKPEGYLGSSMKNIKSVIMRHASQSQHLEIIQMIMKKQEHQVQKAAKRLRDIADEIAETQYEVTARNILTAYTVAKSDLSLSAYSTINKLQKLNGVNLGFHHFERTSGRRMIKSIADTFHSHLIKHIQKSGVFSIILDSSVDSLARNKLVIYIRALENQQPVVYFYRLLDIESSETSEALFNLLIQTFQGDQLYETLMANITGLATDGASVMIGDKSGLKRRLESIVGRPIYSIHCMAHRLHLAVRKVFDNEADTDLYQFETLLNSLYSFYHRSAKRMGSLRNTAEALNVQFYQLNYIHEIRWVASEYNALVRILANWKSIITNLEDIQHEQSNFDQDSRNRAKGYIANIKNPRFLTTLVFLIDGLDCIKIYSRRFQASLGFLIGKEEQRSAMIRSIEDLRLNDGSAMKAFLNEAQCFKRENFGPCNQKDLVNKMVRMKYKDVVFSIDARAQHMPTIDTLREQFANTVSEKLQSYFPEGSLKMFEILVPDKVPVDQCLALNHGQDEIFAFAAFFNRPNPGEIAREWRNLLFSMAADNAQKICELKSLNNIGYFWATLLKDDSLPWTKETRFFVQTALVLPIGSADAERAFSIMNHIRTTLRSSLTHETLESIMRVKINGPAIEDFDAKRYAINWIKEGNFRSEDPRKRGKQQGEEDDEEGLPSEYFTKSALF